VDIGASIKRFQGDRQPERRSVSFDYCFNYFQSFREDASVADIATAENMLLSCLHLGFYLASWGMFRGSSGLRSQSLKQFQPVVELTARTPVMSGESMRTAIPRRCAAGSSAPPATSRKRCTTPIVPGRPGLWRRRSC
jgi:hypothetical protein